MQHLTQEEIARCADETPTEREAAHLEHCTDCTRELVEMREQIRTLAALPEYAAPEAHWARLRNQLVAEGLVGSSRSRAMLGYRRSLRVAAAVALFVGGAATGALLRGAPGTAPVVPGPTAMNMQEAEVRTIGTAATADEATEQLQDAEQLYLAALTRYAELTQADEPVDPVTRLAALEGIVLTAQAALKESPADPVINSYLLTAVGQREAMLRQISNTSGEAWF